LSFSSARSDASEWSAASIAPHRVGAVDMSVQVGENPARVALAWVVKAAADMNAASGP
jgi:hypothetical protein